MWVFFIQYACGSSRIVDEQHAVVGGHRIAEHQAARALGVVVGEFDRDSAGRPVPPMAATSARRKPEATARCDRREQQSADRRMAAASSSAGSRDIRAQHGIASRSHERLPKSPDVAMHNARPLAEAARPDERPAGTEKSFSQGVDGPGNRCMMCGSVGHFGDGPDRDRGAEAESDDL